MNLRRGGRRDLTRKCRLWSVAAACSGLFMTQVAGAHPAKYTLNDVMQAPCAWDMVAAPGEPALSPGRADRLHSCAL
jgi:hypothetical protein